MLAVAVLAAGKGTRMKSALPKVLQPLAGASLVERVLASAGNLQPERRLLIVGHQAERVEQQLAPLGGLEFVLQQPQNGTGHAVQQLIPSLQGFEGELLVLNGDVPLLRSETVEALVQQHRARCCCTNASTVSLRSSGTSPLSTSSSPSKPCSDGISCCTAWPVPFWGCCKTNSRPPSGASCCSTRSA